MRWSNRSLTMVGDRFWPPSRLESWTVKHKLQLVWVTELLCPTAKWRNKRSNSLVCKNRMGCGLRITWGQPTDLFFMIAAPEGANDTHLATLAELCLSTWWKPGFADKTSPRTSTPDQVIAAFDAEEQEAAAEEGKSRVKVKEAASSDKPLIVSRCSLYNRDRPHLHGRRSLIKKGRNGCLAALKPTGHLVSAIAWQ